MLAAAAVGTVEYRSILEHIRSANPVIEYTQGTQFSRHGDFRLLRIDQRRSESFLLWILGVQMVRLQGRSYALYFGHVFLHENVGFYATFVHSGASRCPDSVVQGRVKTLTWRRRSSWSDLIHQGLRKTLHCRMMCLDRISRDVKVRDANQHAAVVH